MRGFFWEDFIGRIIGRIFLGGILCLHCQDFGFCQDFVSMEKEGKFQSLEVRASISHLKIEKKLNEFLFIF